VPGVDVGWLMAPKDGWSASRLESYRTCSFQFYRPLRAPTDELAREGVSRRTPGTRGNVIHEILEDAVLPLVESGRALTPETVQVAVARPARAGARTVGHRTGALRAFGRAALWRYEGDQAIHQMEDLLRREAATSATLGLDRVVGGEANFTQTIEATPRCWCRRASDRPGRRARRHPDRGLQKRPLHPPHGCGVRRPAAVAVYALGASRPAPPSASSPVTPSCASSPARRSGASIPTAPEDAAMLIAAAQVARDVHAAAERGTSTLRPRVATCPSYCAFINACRVNHYTRHKHWSPPVPN